MVDHELSVLRRRLARALDFRQGMLQEQLAGRIPLPLQEEVV